MSKLKLSVAMGNYDRTRPLVDGEVQLDGTDPVYMLLSPEEMFFRAFRDVAFDISELVAQQFCNKDRRRHQPLCRGARLSVAGVSPHPRSASAPTAAFARPPISKAGASGLRNIN